MAKSCAQRLKPKFLTAFRHGSASLKPCPDAKHSQIVSDTNRWPLEKRHNETCETVRLLLHSESLLDPFQVVLALALAGNLLRGLQCLFEHCAGFGRLAFLFQRVRFGLQ